jgi:hypothetical protein
LNEKAIAMYNKKALFVKKILVLIAAAYFISCSKESNPAGPAADPCAGKTIEITATATPSSPCGNTGGITASATGSTGFQFKLNSGGTYQSSGVFSNVGAGAYTVFVKDAGGCEKTKAVTVAAAGTAGPLFSAVKNLIAATCQSCHNNTIQNGGMNWANQCNIIQFQARIKVRAVDQGTMPQGGPELTITQKAVITNWINAGGRFED